MINQTQSNRKAFRDVPYMGVIWVVAEAKKLGFYNGHPDWSNLGQGQPEVGEMEEAPARITNFSIEPSDQAYGPLEGTKELREVIANHYNRLFRKDRSSKYTIENVSVAMGGRLAITRVFAALSSVRIGYQIPDYTAYKDMINYHHGKLDSVCIPTHQKNDFSIPSKEFSQIIKSYNLDAYLFSNPCNPTGKVVSGNDLDTYVKECNRQNCTLINDEFYSHFIYEGTKAGKGPTSAAEYVNEVDEDPIIIIDGLTKSFRYPGWRIGWIIGPKNIINNINRAASAIDGGPSQPIQRAAIEVLQPERADTETTALRRTFNRKRNYMVRTLKANGIVCCTPDPSGTFYIWGDISHLPDPINDSDIFFKEALNRKVMTVPGHFFDISHGHRDKETPFFKKFVRFSFGPTEDNMKMGLARLTEMISSFK